MSPFEAAWHSGSTESNRRTIVVEIGPRLPEGARLRRARSWPPIWSVSSTARPSTDIKLDTNGMPGCGLRQDPLVDRSGEQDPWSGLVEQPRPRVPVVGPLRRRSAGPPTELGSRPTLWATGTAQGPTTARGRSTTSWGGRDQHEREGREHRNDVLGPTRVEIP